MLGKGGEVEGHDPLNYRDLILGKEYWLEEQILKNPLEVAERCVSKPVWILGDPWRPEPWPGMRAPEALTAQELTRVEDCVKTMLGFRRLTTQPDPVTGASASNHVQLVGGGEGVARPHVDSARVCNVAGVLYLHPYPPTTHCGTSFYRLTLPNGQLGGNVCPPQFESISQIPGMKDMEPGMWQEAVEVPYVFNRLLVYRSDIVHSATGYFGSTYELASKRMAVVFFWKAAG
ncbi:MAG: DUF6445 family protein [Nitrospirales bacterium]